MQLSVLWNRIKKKHHLYLNKKQQTYISTKKKRVFRFKQICIDTNNYIKAALIFKKKGFWRSDILSICHTSFKHHLYWRIKCFYVEQSNVFFLQNWEVLWLNANCHWVVVSLKLSNFLFIAKLKFNITKSAYKIWLTRFISRLRNAIKSRLHFRFYSILVCE